MINEFLFPNVNNGVHHESCFCACRKIKLQQYLLDDTRTLRDLELSFLNDADKYRKLNELFMETKARIIRGEGFYQQCLRDTHYLSFGAWMNSEERYDSMTYTEKKKYCRKINMVHNVYINWEQIVTNLTDVDILYIEARKLSINQLSQAISPEWCSDHDESLRDPGEIPDELDYEEEKYIEILRSIRNIGILADIQYDRRKTSIIGRRLQRDMGKMSKIGREIINE